MIYTCVDIFTRISPVLLLLYTALNALLYSNYSWLFITLLVSEILNFILKEIVFRSILGTDGKLVLFGAGARPTTVTYNSNVLYATVTPCAKNHCNTYGMPSGHAQSVAVFSTFMSMVVWNTYKSIPKKMMIISILIFFSIIVMYSRIAWTKCHTRGQVVMGALIGCLIGSVSYVMHLNTFMQ